MESWSLMNVCSETTKMQFNSIDCGIFLIKLERNSYCGNLLISFCYFCETNNESSHHFAYNTSALRKELITVTYTHSQL